MEISEADLQNMTPEQIAELQKKNCIFCHIAAGRVSAKKIFEDDKSLAILDINPANPGHVLLLPKEHYQIMPLVPEDLIAHMMTVTKHISQAQLKAFKCPGTTILVANGLVAGQRAPHFMIHIIPRKEGDEVGFQYETKRIEDSDKKKLFQNIKKRVDTLFGLEQKDPINLDVKPARIRQEILDAEFSTEKPQEKTAQDKSQPKKAEKEPRPESGKNPAERKATPQEKTQKEEPPAKKPSQDKAAPTEPDLDLISRLF